MWSFVMEFKVWVQVLVYDVVCGFDTDLGVDIGFDGSLSWVVSLLLFLMYEVCDFSFGCSTTTSSAIDYILHVSIRLI